MDKQADESQERVKRIRVGLTGLSVVLLIVLLVTALATWSNDQTATGNQAQAEAKDNADEPLSDLGVVPRAADNEATSPDSTGPANATN